MRAAVLAIGLASALAACGPPRSPPSPAPPGPAGDATAPVDAAPPDADPTPAIALGVAEMMDALAAALEGSTDCAVLAGRAAAVLDEHRQARAEAAQAAPRALDAALEVHADRIAAAAARMQPALAACGGDPAFAEAITRFEL